MEQDKTGQVRAVTRALSLMREIAASDTGLTLSDVAQRAGLPASTTHRLLTTMESERFVRFDPLSGVWQIGVNAFVTGAAFMRTRNLVMLAKPYMRQLVEVTGETANILVENAGHVVCIDQVESRHTMRAITQVGGRMPMHASGAGKVLLALMPNERRAKILADYPLVSLTVKTITDPRALLATFAQIRDDGFAFDDEEHADGLRCASAPIFGETGQAVAAVSASGPLARLTDARLPELAEQVREIAAKITAEYGGTPR